MNPGHQSPGRPCRGTVRARTVAAVLLPVLVAAAPAPSATAASVDQMTCAAAQAEVQGSGRYEKRTGFGVVPIIPSRRLPAGQGADCPLGASPSFFVERTRDTSACILGYSCERRDNR